MLGVIIPDLEITVPYHSIVSFSYYQDDRRKSQVGCNDNYMSRPVYPARQPSSKKGQGTKGQLLGTLTICGWAREVVSRRARYNPDLESTQKLYHSHSHQRTHDLHGTFDI